MNRKKKPFKLRDWLDEPRKEITKRRVLLETELDVTPQMLRNWRSERREVPKVYREKIELITGCKFDWPKIKTEDEKN